MIGVVQKPSPDPDAVQVYGPGVDGFEWAAIQWVAVLWVPRNQMVLPSKQITAAGSVGHDSVQPNVRQFRIVAGPRPNPAAPGPCGKGTIQHHFHELFYRIVLFWLFAFCAVRQIMICVRFDQITSGEMIKQNEKLSFRCFSEKPIKTLLNYTEINFCNF